MKRFQEAVASHEAARLIGASDVGSGPALVIVEALDGWDANGLKVIATHITAQVRAAVALFSTASPHAVVIARSPGVPVDAGRCSAHSSSALEAVVAAKRILRKAAALAGICRSSWRPRVRCSKARRFHFRNLRSKTVTVKRSSAPPFRRIVRHIN